MPTPGKVICVSEGNYRESLTRGKVYAMVAMDELRQQICINTDAGRLSWFPHYLFGAETTLVIALKNFTLDDPIELAATAGINVTLEFSTGERRWCLCMTPAALQTVGDWIEGTQIRFHFNNRHVIIMNEITEELIGRALHYIDSQNLLLDCTLPLSK